MFLILQTKHLCFTNRRSVTTPYQSKTILNYSYKTPLFEKENRDVR